MTKLTLLQSSLTLQQNDLEYTNLM